MSYINLSKRLNAAADFAIPGKKILDIGSDHSYLPIYLVQQEVVPSAVAGEVVQGPYTKALEQVTMHQLEKKIDVRFGDGFEVLEETEEVGTIFICGMGGLLISDIINEGLKDNKISKSAQLVLQPNNAEKELRNVLVDNQFKISSETIIEENNKIYEVIVAEYTEEKVNYTDIEFIFGPEQLKERSSLFLKKWRLTLEKNERILKQLENTKNTEKIEELRKKNQQIEKVIA